MFRPQAALVNHAKYKNHPFKIQTGGSSWGKVVARHSDGTVDVAMQNGATYQRVPVESPALSSKNGQVYLPTHDLTQPIVDAHGVWDTPIAANKDKGDIFAHVAFLEGSTRQPIITGFFLPAQNEMSFQTPGIKVDRHESGIYHITLPSGHDEWHFPDGSYLVVGDTTTYDMTTENPNWNPPTQSTAVPIVLNHSSGTTIKILPSGEVEINSVAGITLSASAIASATVGTGAHPVAFADVLASWLSSHTHTSEAAGSPTSTPIQSLPTIAATNLTTD